MTSRKSRLLIALAAIAMPSAAHAQSSAEARRDLQHLVIAPDRDERFTAEALGRLLYLHCSLDEDGTDVRDVLTHLGDALGVPLVARYDDDALGYGIDPGTPITVTLEDVSILEAIEAVLGQCLGPCTWQIRRGFVEVGTTDRLAVPAATEMRLYDVGDLLLDIPTFDSADNPYPPGFGFAPHGHTGPGGEPTRRLPEELAIELVETIVTTIEPGSWDWGQVEYDDPEDLSLVDAPRVDPAPGGPTPEDIARSIHYRRYVPPLKPASIRYWQRHLLIQAPDFIHRQIGGYPEPVVPPGVDPDAEPPSGSMRSRVEDRPKRWHPGEPLPERPPPASTGGH